MLTIKDLQREERGPWLLTLLEGKSWDCCEHLTVEEIATAEGEALIWKKFSKEAQDVTGTLGDTFGLCAADANLGTARVQEVFERCKRRASVDFPKHGWVALHCCGLSEEQKAIVKAKIARSLNFDQVCQARRSCSPVQSGRQEEVN